MFVINYGQMGKNELMSTRCTIAIQDATSKSRTISCNCGGYPAGVGVFLLKYYNTPERVERLISLGNLQYIGANICKEEITYVPGESQSVCAPTEYRNIPPFSTEYESLDGFFDHSEIVCVMNDYISLYQDGVWYADVPFHHYGWRPLAEVIKADDTAPGKAMTDKCRSRLFVICKKTLKSVPIEMGFTVLSVAHSVAIAFNEWDGKYAFERWRRESFRKIICQTSETEFENIKKQLTEQNIAFKVCGESHFERDAELALVVCPREKEKTPKCL